MKMHRRCRVAGVAAGGDADGFLDVPQVHAYPKEGGGTRFAAASAMTRHASTLRGPGGAAAPVILGLSASSNATSWYVAVSPSRAM